MGRRTIRTFILVAALAPAAAPAPARGQSYGTNDQVLTIGGGILRTSLDDRGPMHDDGYTYLYGQGVFWAPLTLPEGAELRQLCFYVNDHTQNASVAASIVAVKLVPGGGGGPAVATIPNTFVSSASDIGYGVYCTSDIGYTMRSTMDVDGDGVQDSVVYYVEVSGGDEADPIGVGGLWLTWGRQISAPPDTPTFADVPASDGAFADVEALAASGITTGCGGGKFCPGATLTRRQMAVFLAKALGLHWTN